MIEHAVRHVKGQSLVHTCCLLLDVQFVVLPEKLEETRGVSRNFVAVSFRVCCNLTVFLLRLLVKGTLAS